MGLGYPPPTPSRQKPLGADFGGSRSIGYARTIRSREPLRADVDGRLRRRSGGKGLPGSPLAGRMPQRSPGESSRSIGPERPREPAGLPSRGLSTFCGSAWKAAPASAFADPPGQHNAAFRLANAVAHAAPV